MPDYGPRVPGYNRPPGFWDTMAANVPVGMELAERARQQKRQDDEREYQHAADRRNYQLGLVGQGGNLGPQPSARAQVTREPGLDLGQATPSRGGEPQVVALPGQVLPGGGSTPVAILSRPTAHDVVSPGLANSQRPTASRVGLAGQPDPRYASVGEGEYEGYVMTPDAREAQQYERTHTRAVADEEAAYERSIPREQATYERGQTREAGERDRKRRLGIAAGADPNKAALLGEDLGDHADFIISGLRDPNQYGSRRGPTAFEQYKGDPEGFKAFRKLYGRTSGTSGTHNLDARHLIGLQRQVADIEARLERQGRRRTTDTDSTYTARRAQIFADFHTTEQEYAEVAKMLRDAGIKVLQGTAPSDTTATASGTTLQVPERGGGGGGGVSIRGGGGRVPTSDSTVNSTVKGDTTAAPTGTGVPAGLSAADAEMIRTMAAQGKTAAEIKAALEQRRR